MTTHEIDRTRAAWDAIAPGYDEFVTSTHTWLAAEGLRQVGLRPGMRFLDVAAGSGALSIPAARIGADVLATDISPSMLERLEARAHREGVVVETRVMDGHELELEDDTFDVAGSQFGVMLFPDMPRGIRELARVTKPGGRVLMIVFGNPQEVEFLTIFAGAIKAVVPTFVPPFDPPPLPFQLRDPRRLRDELTEAGLGEVRIEAVTETLELGPGDDLWNWLQNSNPIPRMILAELGLTDAQLEGVRHAVRELVDARRGPDGVARLTAAANIGVATKK